MKVFRKFLCMILAVVMIAGIMPRVEARAVEKAVPISGAVEHFDENTTVYETMSTEPNTINSTQAMQRINQLISKFEGKFFTVNGSRCTTGSHATECSNCLMSSVVKTTWVKNLVGMGTLDYNLFPAQYDETGDKWSVNGWQCYGFANFAHWYIFAQRNTDNLVSTFIGKGSFTYNTLKSLGALPGDVLRTNWLGGHSMVLISYDSSKVRVLDCNYKDSATTNDACKVQVHDVYFSTVSGKTVGITGVENYDRTAVKTYTVSYNANGGSGAPSSQIKTHDVTLKLSTQKPTRNGYTFLGWATSSSATSAQYQPGGSYTNNASATLYAVWQAQTYTISYNANGGSGAPSSQTKTHGVNLFLSSTVPYKSGYEFKGWQAPNIQGTDGWVKTKPSTGSYETGYKYYVYGYECDHCKDYGYNYDVDYTFYMGNDKNEVISTVKDNPSVYGSYTPSKLRKFWLIETSYKGADYYPGQVGSTYNYFTADYVAEDGTTGRLSIYKTHFYFEYNVYRQSSSTGKIYQPGDMYTVDESVELTAIWNELSIYTVSYNANGGSGAPSSQTKTHDVTLQLSPQQPTRSGYTFLGWATSSSATSAQYQPGGSYTNNASVTLYAVWQKQDTDSPTMTVETVNGSAGKEVTVGISIKNNPGIAGMTFALSYDKTKLELIGYEDSGITGWTVGIENGSASWAEISNYTGNDEILKLKFKVLDNAADGMVSIGIVDLEIFNEDEDEVKTVAVSGGINITNRIPGDVNDDGKVDARDAIRLAKYLAKIDVEVNLANADVNGDNKVDARDLIRLKKYLAKMSVELV